MEKYEKRYKEIKDKNTFLTNTIAKLYLKLIEKDKKKQK